jgi:hydroxyethylthiazole kinase-like uncharacterized protein yjeF
MDYIVNSAQMKACDRYTIEEIGLPSLVLMERAALCIAEEIYRLPISYKKRILVVCGTGNNGGDGLAAARLLYLSQEAEVEILLAGEEEKFTAEAKIQLDIVRKYGIPIREQVIFDEYTIIIDAIFGIGLTRDINGNYEKAVRNINKSRAFVVSVDIPSGVNGNDGSIMGEAVKADLTVTMAFQKLGNILYPGASFAGKVIVKDIGITDACLEYQYPVVFSYTKNDLSRVPKRSVYSNKGTYGKVLIIASSYNMSGAAYLCAKAAYTMGTGLVQIYAPEENRIILQSMLPEAILTTYNKENVDFKIFSHLLEWADVVGFGPGMGTEAHSVKILEKVLKRKEKTLVIDADGINILSQNKNIKEQLHSNVILTPHVGEMARLLQKEIKEIAKHLIIEAKSVSDRWKLTCVLKDSRTIITHADETVYINLSGNHAMATGGAGDVLTGVILGLLAQKSPLKEAAVLGAYIHGLAGEAASKKKNHYSVLAEDIIDGLIDVLKEAEDIAEL